jgi:hypothetical protein
MASIRKLKKDLNYLAYELLTEVFTYRHFHSEMKEKKFDEVILEVIKLRNELIARINNPENPDEIKAHYKKIRTEMVNLVKVVDGLAK